MVSMSTLMGQVTGQFRIRTRSGSTYWLDLDRHEMCRIPAPDDPDRVHTLRRDRSTVRLLSVVECSVGRSMQLLIDLAVPGVDATTRRSTPVTAIERITPDLASDRGESMIRRQAPSDGEPGSSGITRLITEHGSVLLIDGDLRAYRRTPGPAALQLPGDQEWLSFAGIGPVEIGSPLTVVSASQVTGRYVSSPLVTIKAVRPARELSAAEIETVHFVGGYINYGAIPQIKFEP